MPRRPITRITAAVAVALAALTATALPANAHPKPEPGRASLAALLAQDGAGFDGDWNDYDILDNAVTAVLTAKPSSPVAVLADGDTALTAFLPTDRAFRRLAQDLTKKSYKSEAAVFTALAKAVGVDTIESVLLYHVVPGATIDYRSALRADGARLATALDGSSVRVNVVHRYIIKLQDADRNDPNPFVVDPNLNRGNRQIAHGITEVLRPADL